MTRVSSQCFCGCANAAAGSGCIATGVEFGRDGESCVSSNRLVQWLQELERLRSARLNLVRPPPPGPATEAPTLE
jgi:hypothetical protein